MRIALAAGLLTLTPAIALAATQSVVEDASYALGDNDTRAQAREICLAKAERKALDSSGSLVESEMDVASKEVPGGASDQAAQHVRSYVGAVVNATDVHDNFHLEGDRMVVDCSATVSFNPDDVRERMKQMHADNVTKQQVDQQQNRIATLESEVQTLKTQLTQQEQALTQAQLQARAQAQAQAMAQAQKAQALALAQAQQTQAQAQQAQVQPQAQQAQLQAQALAQQTQAAQHAQLAEQAHLAQQEQLAQKQQSAQKQQFAQQDPPLAEPHVSADDEPGPHVLIHHDPSAPNLASAEPPYYPPGPRPPVAVQPLGQRQTLAQAQPVAPSPQAAAPQAASPQKFAQAQIQVEDQPPSTIVAPIPPAQPQPQVQAALPPPIQHAPGPHPPGTPAFSMPMPPPGAMAMATLPPPPPPGAIALAAPPPVYPRPMPQLASAGGARPAIRPGMSEGDLVRTVGDPIGSIHEYGRTYSWSYGRVWVTMNGGMIQCISLQRNPYCQMPQFYR